MLDTDASALCNLLEPADEKERDLLYRGAPELPRERTQGLAVYLPREPLLSVPVHLIAAD